MSDFKEEQSSLSQEFKRANSWASDRDRIFALNDFIMLTDSSSLPDVLKDRFKASADKEIESIALRHADIDLFN